MSKPEPNIVVFACNWDGLSSIEAAAQSGLSYPASIKVVRISCLSRMHHGLILKAFELGADGVILLGCTSGNCHFNNDSAHIVQIYEKVRSILKLLGLGEKRLALLQLPRGDGQGFVDRAARIINDIKQIHPVVYTRVQYQLKKPGDSFTNRTTVLE